MIPHALGPQAPPWSSATGEGSRVGALVTPGDRERFLAEVEARVPGLAQEGENLVRDRAR